eukprot:UC1_evm1s46
MVKIHKALRSYCCFGFGVHTKILWAWALLLALQLAIPRFLVEAATATPLPTGSSRVFDVTDYGAVGNGVHDDTVAFQSTFDALGSLPGLVHVPTGAFLITGTVRVASPGLFTLRGDGPGSNLLWAFNGTLLQFAASAPVAMATISSFTISSIRFSKPPAVAAMVFEAGLVKSQIESVQLIGAGGLPATSLGVDGSDGMYVGSTGGGSNSNSSNNGHDGSSKGDSDGDGRDGDGRDDRYVGSDGTTFAIGSGFDLGNVTDTVAVRNCLLWFGSGTGIRIGHGSEVRVEGGRFIGTKTQGGPLDSIGVHVTGNNGGVHIVSTDIISWGTGMQLDASNGQGSNREIFVSHGTLDSNGRGLSVFDSSYVSIAGCWAASSDLDNIWTHPDSNPQLSIAGGTIFNAGTLVGPNGCGNNGQCNGITVNAGTFVLSGVEVRNNRGVGIWTPSARTTGYVVTGSRITDNGFGARLSGRDFAVTGCVFSGNKNGSLTVANATATHVVANNIGV